MATKKKKDKYLEDQIETMSQNADIFEQSESIYTVRCALLMRLCIKALKNGHEQQDDLIQLLHILCLTAIEGETWDDEDEAA